MTDPLDNIIRASGDAVCKHCSRTYYRHPLAREILGYDGTPFLYRLCDGTLVKL